jgi:branched-chain amino acid transport system substrate-binding protein
MEEDSMAISLRALATLGVLSLTLAGCPAADEPPAQPDVDEEPIILGGAFSMTGWMAAYDAPPREGAQVAIDYINEQGGVLGRPLQLIEVDSETDPARAGEAAIELLDRGAVVLITPCDFDIGAPVGIEAQRAGIPAISTCATSPGFPGAVGDMMFMAAFGNNAQGAAAAEWAFEEQGWRTAYLVIDQAIDYTRSLGAYFRETWEELGGEIIGEDTYDFGDEDFSAQVSRMRALDVEPDFMYFSALVPDYGIALRQMRAAGLTFPVLAGDGVESELLVEVAGADAANNSFFTTHGFVGEGGGDQAALFAERYEARFGERPETSFHAIGWDTVHIIAAAIELAGSTDGAAVRDAMRQLTDVPGATGRTITYSPDWPTGHVPQKSVAIIEVRDGAFELATWWDPARIPEAR